MKTRLHLLLTLLPLLSAVHLSAVPLPNATEPPPLTAEERALINAARRGEPREFLAGFDELCRSERREWEEELLNAALKGGDAAIFRALVRHPRRLTQTPQRENILRPLAAGFRPYAFYLLRELLEADPAPYGMADILDQLYEEPHVGGFAPCNARRAVIATILQRDYGASCQRPECLQRLRDERDQVLREHPILRPVLDGSYTPLPADCSDRELLTAMEAAYGTREQLMQLFRLVDTERRFRDRNWRDAAGRTPLLYAAKWGDWLMLDCFLRLGADSEAKDAEGRGLREQNKRPQTQRFIADCLCEIRWEAWQRLLEEDLARVDAELDAGEFWADPDESRANREGSCAYARELFAQATAAAMQLRATRLALLAEQQLGEAARAEVDRLMEQDFRSLSQCAPWMEPLADGCTLPNAPAAVQERREQRQDNSLAAERLAAANANELWLQLQGQYTHRMKALWEARKWDAHLLTSTLLLRDEERHFHALIDVMEELICPFPPLSGSGNADQTNRLIERLIASREAFLRLLEN